MPGCKPINYTAEQVRNIISNRGMLFPKIPNQTWEDTETIFNFIQENVDIPDIQSSLKPYQSPRYYFMGARLRKRVSDKPQNVYENSIGRLKARREHDTNNNLASRDAGSFIHLVLGDLVNFQYNNKGNYAQIKRDALGAEWGLGEENFNVLEKTARDVIKDIEAKQAQINKIEGTNHRAKIFVEQFLIDSVYDEGGTSDVIALYSNNKATVYDYKTIGSTSQKYKKVGDTEQLVEDLITPSKMQSYQLSLGSYKRILVDRLGVKSVDETRVIPIHLRFGVKPREQWKDGDHLLRKINLVESGADMSEFLKVTPIDEKSKYAGINEILKRQQGSLARLRGKLKSKKTSTDERHRIQERIAALRKSMRSTVVDGDIEDIIKSTNALIDRVKDVYQQETTEDKLPNPRYIDDSELEDIINELSVYEDIVENTYDFFWDLRSENKELYDKLQNNVKSLTHRLANAMVAARKTREERILKLISEEFKDAEGNLIPSDDLGFFQANFNRMSEVDHPAFKVAWNMIQSSQYQIRQAVAEIDENVGKVETALFSWAKTQGMSRQEAFNKMVNFETGNLHSVVKADLLEKVKIAYTNGDVEFLQSVFEYKDRKTYEKGLQDNWEFQQAKTKARYNNLETSYDPETGDLIKTGYELKEEYDKTLSRWVRDNALIESDQAWANEFNRKHLKFKDSVVKENYSKEYQYILANKPVLDYYNFYTNQNRILREAMGIDSYTTLPDNFIASIRKDFMDHLSEDGLHIGAALRELGSKTFTVRDEDIFIGERDATGELYKNIPLLFTNPLMNKNGEIDHTLKSYDLSKSLVTFSKIAYNYKYMTEIEPKIMALKELLGDPTPGRSGVQVVDSLGRKVKGLFEEYVTKSGREGTEIYKLFEDLTDWYLYGIKFKNKSIKIGKLNSTKLLVNAKQFWSKVTLSFAVFPAAGAFIAGKTATHLEGKKGIAFTSKHARESYASMRDLKQYKAISAFFDIYAEDQSTRLAEKRASNKIAKFTDVRYLFGFLRGVDENINDHIVNSMIRNFGLDVQGNLVRMNAPGAKTEGVMSLKDLIKYDPINKKLSVDRLTDQSFVQFRNAARQTSTNIIGSLSQEDASRVDTNLVLNMLSHFRSWMPGIVQERFGNLKYDKDLQAVKWGRFKVLGSEFTPTDVERDNGLRWMNFAKTVVFPTAGKLVLDLMTFGLSHKAGMTRVNNERALRQFAVWKDQNPQYENVTFEQFLETKHAQMRAVLAELRIILGVLALIGFMGAEGDDGKPRYKGTWLRRKGFTALAKGASELTFMWNPSEFAQLLTNPLPLAGMITKAMRTTKNGVNEVYKLMFDINEPMDKTPIGYYGLQWMYGGSQIMRVFEVYKQFEESPYLKVNL